MKDILLVGLGGFFGSVARYKLGGLILHNWTKTSFPLSTFTVNVLGCLFIGVLGALSIKYHWFGPQTRLLFIAGLLGGFTTFSAFGFQTLLLIRRGQILIAASYVLLSVCFGVLAVWFGGRIVLGR